MLNELSFSEGDTIELQSLQSILDQNKQFLQNTLLFNRVNLKVSEWMEDKVTVKIDLEEFWYIFPIPQFELADRNFNVWWVRYNRDMRRANLGLWVLWRNISGHNDLLKAVAQFGFTRKFELEYTLPPMNRNRKLGFEINVLYSDNKEKDYDIEDNRLAFFSDLQGDVYHFSRIRFRSKIFYRQNRFLLHSLSASYLGLSISDTLAKLNPDFFMDGKKEQQSFNINYKFKYNKVDRVSYPLEGFLVDVELHKKGLGIFSDVNLFYTKIGLAYYFNTHQKFSIQTALLAKFQFLRNQLSYYDNTGLGYQDEYVRGYQYNVINGQDYLLFKNDLNFKLMDLQLPFIKKSRIVALNTIPIKLHLRMHLDIGKVWDAFNYQYNSLNNRLMIGTGLGLDLIFYEYNLILQFEYSMNNLGSHGLFFKYKFNI